jgi:hypothetical protein
VQASPLQLAQVQLQERVLGVLAPACLPVQLKLRQSNAHQNANECNAHERFDQGKACGIAIGQWGLGYREHGQSMSCQLKQQVALTCSRRQLTDNVSALVLHP